MLHRSLMIFICSTLTITNNCSGQQILTIEEAIAATLKNNYDIQLLRNDSALNSLNYQFRNAAFLPKLNASGTAIFNNNNQMQLLADGSQRKQNGLRSDNLNASVNLNWTVFDGFKMFVSRDKLTEFLKLGQINIKDQITNAVSEVIKTYYNIVSQKQQLKAIEEQMGINEERAKLADKKLSTGLGAKPELLQAKLDLNAQRAARLKQLNLIEQLKEQLNQLLAFVAGTTFEVSDSIPFVGKLAVSDIMGTAEINNPTLQVMKQNVRIAGLTLKERKAERFPTISFNSAYNFSKTNNKAVVNNFTPLYNRNYGFNYGLGINIPILNNLTVTRNIKAAQLEISYQQLLLEYQRAKVNISINSAFKDFEMQKQILELEEDNIKMAKENVYIGLERLRLGISTSLELRETQKSLEDAYTRLIAARYNTKLAETALLKLRGDLVK